MHINISFYINTIYLIIVASVLIGILLGRLSMSARKMLQSIHGKNPVTIDYDSIWIRHG
jgi:uncharacterized protein YneF (UPF0154 family)